MSLAHLLLALTEAIVRHLRAVTCAHVPPAILVTIVKNQQVIKRKKIILFYFV